MLASAEALEATAERVSAVNAREVDALRAKIDRLSRREDRVGQLLYALATAIFGSGVAAVFATQKRAGAEPSARGPSSAERGLGPAGAGAAAQAARLEAALRRFMAGFDAMVRAPATEPAESAPPMRVGDLAVRIGDEIMREAALGKVALTLPLACEARVGGDAAKLEAALVAVLRAALDDVRERAVADRWLALRATEQGASIRFEIDDTAGEPPARRTAARAEREPEHPAVGAADRCGVRFGPAGDVLWVTASLAVVAKR